MTPSDTHPAKYVHWDRHVQSWRINMPDGKYRHCKKLEDALALNKEVEEWHAAHPKKPKAKPNAEDTARCRSCKWGCKGFDGVPGCSYSEHHIHSRLWLHYQRTGAEDPKTMRHGVGCLEYEPNKGAKAEGDIVLSSGCPCEGEEGPLSAF